MTYTNFFVFLFIRSVIDLEKEIDVFFAWDLFANA